MQLGTKADAYQQQALDADEKAKRVKDRDAKEVYLQIAEHWRVMTAIADLRGE